MKRCKFCGREGARMTPIRNRWSGEIDWWKCTSPVACIRRQQQLGQWHGKRVFYRQDADGTRWTIRSGVNSSGPPYSLTCECREHRLVSWHTTVEAAKAHADDLIASLVRPILDDYTVDETVDDQLELR